MDKQYRIKVYFVHGIDFTFEGPDFTEEVAKTFEEWANSESCPIMTAQVNEKKCILNREFLCAMTIDEVSV